MDHRRVPVAGEGADRVPVRGGGAGQAGRSRRQGQRATEDRQRVHDDLGAGLLEKRPQLAFLR